MIKFKRKSDITYLLASILAPFVGMLNTLVASRYVGPAEMGVINKYLLLNTYISFFQLGIFNGLNRNIAYYNARKEFKLVRSMVDTSFGVASLISGLSLVGTFIYFIYALLYLDPIVKAASFLLMVVLSTSNMINHYEVTYRSSVEFKKLGNIKIKESFLSMLLIWTPIYFNYLGYVISYGLKQIYSLCLRFKKAPFKIGNSYSFSSYKMLIKVGFPLLLEGYIWSLFSVSDQTYIALNLSREDMGLYNIARQCTVAIMVIPNAINTLLYPKAAFIYGESNDRKALKKFWGKSLLLYIAIMVPISIVGYLILPYFVEYFLPKYVGGIKAGQISILSGLTYIYFGPAVIFGTLKKNTPMIIITLALFGTFWGLSYAFPTCFESIEGIALLRLILFVILMLFAIILSFKFIK